MVSESETHSTPEASRKGFRKENRKKHENRSRGPFGGFGQRLLRHFADQQKEENHTIFQNTAVPEGPRKEKGGFPEGVPEG